jgi:hypothetical protein
MIHNKSRRKVKIIYLNWSTCDNSFLFTLFCWNLLALIVCSLGPKNTSMSTLGHGEVVLAEIQLSHRHEHGICLFEGRHIVGNLEVGLESKWNSYLRKTRKKEWPSFTWLLLDNFVFHTLPFSKSKVHIKIPLSGGFCWEIFPPEAFIGDEDLGSSAVCCYFVVLLSSYLSSLALVPTRLYVAPLS